MTVLRVPDLKVHPSTCMRPSVTKPSVICKSYGESFDILINP